MVTRGRQEAEGQPGEERERHSEVVGGRRASENGRRGRGEERNKRWMGRDKGYEREKMRGVCMRDRKRLSGRNFL